MGGWRGWVCGVWVGGGGRKGGLGERRIEVFGKNHKKKSGGGSGGKAVRWGVGLVGESGWM